MKTITLNDLTLINNLCSRKYTGNKLLSNATKAEYDHLKTVKAKLRNIADYFSGKYGEEFGPFYTGISSGNPIAIGGTRFNNVWSGIFKGSTKKQYSAQISFVMNRQETCLNVGFYFGAASAHNLSREQREEFESQLNALGVNLSNTISNNAEIRARYETLFNDGFQSFSDGNRVLPTEWINTIANRTANSQIFTKIYPNDFGEIENSTIDSFVAQTLFLMGAIDNAETPEEQRNDRPLTPDQRAEQAKRQAQIGHKGELFALKYERNRLKVNNIITDKYPRHVALESMNFGYDILSVNNNGDELFIEVKTTTRTQDDLGSRKFYISNNELNTYDNEPDRYLVYRVYDIDNNPVLEEIDLEITKKNPNGFIINY